jgi:NADPH:quinone reductase-like Zn-dependent oxidoreductase
VKALRIHAHGGPEVLRVDDVPVPEPRAGEVLVKVLAASINHLDLWVRRGMPGFAIPFPRVLGCDGTGEIAALGPGVTGLRVGERVVLEPGFTSRDVPLGEDDHFEPDYGIRGEHADGLMQEFVALPARHVFPLPRGVDPIRAAAVPLVFLTAWGMLMTRAKLRPGETALVLGGAGGVGSAAIQIAKQHGARVIATAGSESKRALARELGADATVDSTKDGWDKDVKKLTDGRGCDVVVEHVGPATWDASMRCLARLGRLVTCGGTTGAKVSVTLPHLFIKNLSILGSTMGPRSALRTIFEHVAAGRYRPVVDSTLPLGRAREAHERLEARGVSGKIVLIPAEGTEGGGKS